MDLSEIARERLRLVRTSLILTNAFFGTLVMRLKLVEAEYLPQAMVRNEKGEVGILMRQNSCAVDGKNFYYNPKFLQTLTDAELKGVFCHEVLHCAMGHPWRVGERNKLLANIAMDFAINPVVVESGMTLPKDALLDPKFNGLPFEQIYTKLLEQMPPEIKKEIEEGKQGGQGGEGEGGGGEGKDKGQGQGKPQDEKEGKGKGQGQPKDAKGKGNGSEGSKEPKYDRWGGVVSHQEEDAKEQESQWKVAAVQAATAAKQQGNLPAGLQRLVDEAVRNKVDWKSALRRFMQQSAKNDYSWRMPSPRYASQGLYLPRLYSETMPPVVVVVDTSGSIGQEELNVFHAELTSIIEECRPEKTWLVYCDAAVANVQEFIPGDPLEFKPGGGGGTNMPAALDWVDKEGIEPACVIVLTDGYTPFGESREYPVLWAITTRDIESPWGESLYLGDDL